MVAFVGLGEASDWARWEQPHASSTRSNKLSVAVLRVISACRANDRNHAVAARDSPLPTHAFGDLRAFLGSSESLPL